MVTGLQNCPTVRGNDCNEILFRNRVNAAKWMHEQLHVRMYVCIDVLYVAKYKYTSGYVRT